jgi:hypothetical protein
VIRPQARTGFPERHLRIVGDGESGRAPLLGIAAAWALVLALATVAFACSAVP